MVYIILVFLLLYIVLMYIVLLVSGADPGFQVRGAHLKIFGVFRVKNQDFTPKNLIFFQF